MADVTMLAGALDGAADTLERAAADVRRQAAAMRVDGDVTRAAEAASAVANAIGNCRLDLFVTRAVRVTAKA